jgi:hypothetical protein
VMTQSIPFGKTIAYIGVAAFSLSLLDYLRQALTSSVLVALPVILLGALFLLVWFIMVGLRLWRLGTAQRLTVA